MGTLRDSAAFLGLALAEAVWPTRCVVCDLPGDLLCRKCRMNLPYIDQLQACPTCGAPWGRGICCECNHQTLSWRGMDRFPLDGCASAVMLTPTTRRMVTVFKDRGEERMAQVLAEIMANTLPPGWQDHSLLVPIPARKRAERKRGFDHMEMIAAELSSITGIPHLGLLEQKQRRDQRELDARQRLENMRGSIAVKPGKRALVPRRVIVVDDVFTTGATLFTTAATLRQAGAQEVLGLTFIRA